MKQTNFPAKKQAAPLSAKNAPLNVISGREYEVNGETRTHWTQVGTAFKTDKGINVLLNSFPVNGKMFITEKQVEQ